MLRVRTPALLLVVLTLLSVACGGNPPDKEMQQAQDSIDAARAAGAAEYAPEEFVAAEEALRQSRTAVTQRDFRLALNHALDSRERAETARAEAGTRKATARTEAERALVTARAALTTAEEKLKTVEGGRAPATALAAPRESISTASQRLQEAGTALSAGDYLGANTAIVAAMQALSTANAALDAVTPPAPRRRR